MDNALLSEQISQSSHWISKVKSEVSKVLVGQDELVDRLLIGLLCKGHILLEGLPGLAKTLAVKSLAGTLGLDFSRVQFTPDLLPADLLGTMIYHPEEKNFHPKLGPVFSNIVLADEINRAPAKVQSALLEAMQERQVTLGDQTHPLPSPFLVLATQNPIDQEGTYSLPEAQLDRFLLKVTVDYPNKTEEIAILDRMAHTEATPETQQVTSPEAVAATRELVNQIYIDPSIREYIVDLIQVTRKPSELIPGMENLIQAGASPRATINFALAGRARACMQGRAYVTPQDIKDLAPSILRHRILLSFEAEAEEKTTDDLITQILDHVPVP